MKRILALEPEAVGQESLFGAMQIVFDDANIHLETMSDVEEFNITLEKSQGDAILINFQIDQFLTMRASELESFISSIRSHQKGFIPLFGITSDPHQKLMLQKVGIMVCHKVYDPRQLANIPLAISKRQRKLTIEEIGEIVCDHQKIPKERLHQRNRKREFVKARQITMYLSKAFTKDSLETIGNYFGGRDHTTVIHSCQAVKDLMDSDPNYKNNVIMLQTKVSLAAGF